MGQNSNRVILFAVGELVLAAWILVGVWPRTSALTALMLLSIFSGPIAFEATREIPRPCGCFGAPATVSDPAFVRHNLWIGLGVNLILMAGAYTLAARRGKKEST
jgi:uncharacterized membrane protein YphA (DoxX/SURF4 family)